MTIYRIRYRDCIGRWTVGFVPANSYDDAIQIAIHRGYFREN